MCKSRRSFFGKKMFLQCGTLLSQIYHRQALPKFSANVFLSAIELLPASRNLSDYSGGSRMRWVSTGCGLTDVGQSSRASPITRRQVQYTSISVKSATKCPIGTLSSSLPVFLSVCLTHNIYCYSGSFWFFLRNGIGFKKKMSLKE